MMKKKNRHSEMGLILARDLSWIDRKDDIRDCLLRI